MADPLVEVAVRVYADFADRATVAEVLAVVGRCRNDLDAACHRQRIPSRRTLMRLLDGPVRAEAVGLRLPHRTAGHVMPVGQLASYRVEQPHPRAHPPNLP